MTIFLIILNLKNGLKTLNKKIEFYSTRDIPISHTRKYVELISKVVLTDSLIDGDSVRAFEEKFANFIGTDHCLGVGNGLDALFLILSALEISKGDKVAVQAHTFIATWLAVLKVGAIPIGIDVDDSGQMNLDELEKHVDLKCVIVVHMHGRSCDLPRLKNWTDSNAVFLIEDCAQAHGLAYNEKRAGSWGVASAFSFYPTKNLFALGDAGAICSSNKEIIVKCKKISRYGTSADNKYKHALNGINSRLDSIHAAVLSYSINYLDEWNLSRNRIASLYDLNLSEKIVKPKLTNSVNHHYDIKINNRNVFRNRLLEKGIGTEIHYPINASHEVLGTLANNFPIASWISDHTLSLPISPWQDDEDTQSVIDTVNTLIKSSEFI